MTASAFLTYMNEFLRLNAVAGPKQTYVLAAEQFDKKNNNQSHPGAE